MGIGLDASSPALPRSRRRSTQPQVTRTSQVTYLCRGSRIPFMRDRLYIALAGLACLIAGSLILAKQSWAHNLPGTRHNREHAIVHAFCKTLRPCPLGREAVRVAECESGPNLWNWARNGDYWGMFQFGSFARSAYGFSWSPWVQA